MAQEELTTLPVGRLGLVPLESCRSLGQKVDEWLVKWRKEREHSESDSFAFEGYKRDSYTIKVQNPRFGSGEGKCVITESVRGDDVYILVDVCNYNISYPIGKYTNLMSPDDHYQDLKRVIAAIGGKARRVNVIMPYLYEGRQSKRIGRESLDCATSLHELINMGVENIITFDAHDPQIQNATPLHGFETVQPSYQFIKALLNHEQGLHIDNEHFMIIGESKDTKDADRFAEVEKIEKMSPEERFAFFQKELSKCIRCNACRNACPACSCRKCVFDSTKFDSAQKANVDSFEEKMFHIIRAFHVAGRCTDCGECSRVCPQGIPLHLFNRKFIKDIDTFYGEYQAGADAESKGPLTSFTFDDVEPGVVAERG